jgi:hypothetical protein
MGFLVLSGLSTLALHNYCGRGDIREGLVTRFNRVLLYQLVTWLAHEVLGQASIFDRSGVTFVSRRRRISRIVWLQSGIFCCLIASDSLRLKWSKLEAVHSPVLGADFNEFRSVCRAYYLASISVTVTGILIRDRFQENQKASTSNVLFPASLSLFYKFPSSSSNIYHP